MDPEPFVRGTDPHQNVMDPQHFEEKVGLPPGRLNLVQTFRIRNVLLRVQIPDPYHGLRTPIWIRILLLSSGAFKMSKNNENFFYYYLGTVGCGTGTGPFISLFKDNKSLRNHKTVEIKIFFQFFCLMMEGSGFQIRK